MAGGKNKARPLRWLKKKKKNNNTCDKSIDDGIIVVVSQSWHSATGETVDEDPNLAPKKAIMKKNDSSFSEQLLQLSPTMDSLRNLAWSTKINSSGSTIATADDDKALSEKAPKDGVLEQNGNDKVKTDRFSQKPCVAGLVKIIESFLGDQAMPGFDYTYGDNAACNDKPMEFVFCYNDEVSCLSATDDARMEEIKRKAKEEAEAKAKAQSMLELKKSSSMAKQTPPEKVKQIETSVDPTECDSSENSSVPSVSHTNGDYTVETHGEATEDSDNSGSYQSDGSSPELSKSSTCGVFEITVMNLFNEGKKALKIQ